ncbi:MAG: fibronectin type III domain-containing protein [Dehalococcoides mccartyi]|uniref:fibronectin type III domain-containing protein n=1 Tax=Dehalococcoides TaxID=61434 RepID=UPI002737F2F8|nr:fibronectin type III domain-containing protein [Dehalococcoides mccartyi]MDP4278980.1 fibronectin type III domain-containing protein [Dehalococcoides mccartyi]
MFKTKISKVLGVVLTAAMVLSMFAVATPVAAANQAWSKISLPGSGATGGYVVSDTDMRFYDIGILEWNADKTAIYASAVYDDGDATLVRIFKSTDAGRTWKMVFSNWTGSAPVLDGPYIFDICASSVNANEVYFTDGYDIYTTKDGGVTWNKLSNVYIWADDNDWANQPEGLIVTLDVGYAGANKYVFTGTASFGTTGVNGVYMCQETAFGMPWSDLSIATQGHDWTTFDGIDTYYPDCNVWDVVVDPTDFATKQGVIAVAQDNDGNTWITAKYFGNQWNQPALCKDAEVLVSNDETLGSIYSVYHAELWLPSDFNSSLTSGKFQAWLALATMDDQGDVYLWYGGATKTIDLNVSGLDTETEVSDIDGAGGVGTAKLIIGGYLNSSAWGPNTWYSADGLTFTKTSKAPTGDDSWYDEDVTVLALADFATSGKALAGTGGWDCAVSYTADFGKTWNQISMLRQAINEVANIAGNLFVVTYDYVEQSVWRLSGGVYERVFSTSMVDEDGDIDVAVSPAGDAVFVATLGGTMIWRSLDNGQTFAQQVSSITTAGGAAINSWFVSNANTILVGGDNVVYQTSTNGVLWFARTCAVGTVTSFAVSTDGSTLVAAGSAGKVSKSTDGGVTWSTASAAAPTVSAVSLVTFQNGSNSVVYLTGNSGRVYKYDFAATTPAWSTRIDNVVTDDNVFDSGAYADVDNGVGIFSGIASGGNVLYVLDGTWDNVIRITNVGLSYVAGIIPAPATAGSATKLIGVAAPGANMLYGIFDDELYVYTDKMAVPVANVQATKVTTDSFTVTWDALNVDNSNVTVSYFVFVWDGAVAVPVCYGIDLPNVTTATSMKFTDLDEDTVYQISVWAVSPVMSFVGTASVSTQPQPLTYTVNLMPTNGASNVPVNPVFAWDAVSTAVSYDLVLSTDPTFADATKVLATKNLTTNYWAYDGTLSNSTSYYWRVRVNTANSTSEWFPAVFTTVKADAAPVEVNNPPDITLEVPQAETPAYIWLIVAVGAVLTIAVIVLIVRTRRVV